jgi:hypothetical protein
MRGITLSIGVAGHFLSLEQMSCHFQGAAPD